MKKNKLFWILTVGCALNFAAHLYFYPSLPDIVPTTGAQADRSTAGGRNPPFDFGRSSVCNAYYV